LVLLVVQSPGSASVNVVSAVTGVTGPLLWTVALPVTVKALPAVPLAGDDAVEAVTFRSVLAVTAVVELALVMLLLAPLDSATCNWSGVTEAVELKLWLEGPVHVTDQMAAAGVAVDCTSRTFCTVAGFALLVVQSPGRSSVKVTSAVTGVTGPLLWTVALPLTVKGVPALAVAGAVAVEAVTLRSAEAVIGVTSLFDPLLLAGFVSTTCCWSTTREVLTVNVWFEGFVQVTFHETGLPGTVVPEDTARDVFCTVSGFVDGVVQPPGITSVNVVSTFTGPNGPLLWSTAEPVTGKGVPAVALAGEFTVTLLTFGSAFTRMLVVRGLLVPELLAAFGSLT
jgi:hypothetical protein